MKSPACTNENKVRNRLSESFKQKFQKPHLERQLETSNLFIQKKPSKSKTPFLLYMVVNQDPPGHIVTASLWHTKSLRDIHRFNFNIPLDEFKTEFFKQVRYISL